MQIDTFHVRPQSTVDLRQFSAIDVVVRIAWSTVRTRAARDFVVELVDALPFRITAIHVDGCSEFMVEFELACRALQSNGTR